VNQHSSFHIPTLNGWRAVAILAVMFFHASYAFFAPSGRSPDPVTFEFFKHFAFGVNIFFGISGFLIIARLHREEEQFSSVSLKEFYLRRLFRILPPMLVYFLFILCLDLFKALPESIKIGDYASALFFFKNYYPESNWYFGHFWSLSFEEHFYLIWPLVFVFFPRRRPFLILALLLAIPLWRAVEYRQDFFGQLFQPVPAAGRTDLHFDYILWGGVSAYFYNSNLWREKLRRYFPPYSLIFFFTLLIAIKTNLVPIPLKDFTLGLLIQLCLLATVFNANSFWGIFFENKVFEWIGKLSYSLYLWQQFFLAEPASRINDLPVLQQLPWNIGLCFLIAWLSYQLVELPALKFGRRYLTRRF
jgi:peptidoglycan/LPS O-acetylase OafA/YrhL